MTEADYFIEQVDGIQIRLKEPFDLSFLHQYGTVFMALDAQSSGNLCFGVEKAGKRYFIKFAGANTINNYDLPIEDAIARLKATVPKYRELTHPLLVRLVNAEAVGNGFALVFDWEDGESIGDLNPSAGDKFRLLPISEKVSVFDKILRFHEHVARYGYVAIDFNDNSTLYNFGKGNVVICDIDFYAKQSYINGMGRIFGIAGFMSPEEFRISGLLDEITNVYTMGAVAFWILADGDRSRSAWPLGVGSYDVPVKAVSEKRDQRQQSIGQLMHEWNAAL